jgi:hypothetical protein
MARPKHPEKEIEAVIVYAEELGWQVVKRSGHCWARLLCPQHNRDGCQISVFSTPQNPGDHARRIRRALDRCMHLEAGNEKL